VIVIVHLPLCIQISQLHLRCDHKIKELPAVKSDHCRVDPVDLDEFLSSLWNRMAIWRRTVSAKGTERRRLSSRWLRYGLAFRLEFSDDHSVICRQGIQ
jgi:hypothetical protein